MRNRAIMLGLFLALSRPAWGIDALVRVANGAEFAALAPHRLLSGWDVRLALADPGAGAGKDAPWMLLYCEARYVGTDPPPIARADQEQGEALGPVFYRVSWEGDAKREAGRRQSGRPALKEGLYCAAIPTGRKGTCHVVVLDGQGNPLAETDVEVREAVASPWQSFAQVYRAGEAQHWGVMGASMAAVPNYPGEVAISDVKEQRGLENRYKGAMPGMVEETPGLELSLVPAAGGQPGGAVLALKSAQAKLIDRPDYFLLARWWLNDKPIIAPPAKSNGRAGSGALRPTNEIDVEFALPEALAAAKVGDKVGLQLMYSPGGYEVITNEAIRGTHQASGPYGGSDIAVPVLSNKLEFTLTGDLLRKPVR
jgi:hypothetical protein